jgi:hypothetical protein
MVLDKPNAGTMVIVQGGERSSKSINKTMDGTAWKLRSSRHQHRPHKTLRIQTLVLTSMQRKDHPGREHQALIDLASH